MVVLSTTLTPSFVPTAKVKPNPDNNLYNQYSNEEENLKKNTLIGKWTPRDILYASFICLVHVLCLLAPFTFSWGALATAYLLYVLTGLFGVMLSYHRNLAHKSFKLPKYLEYTFAYFALQAYQGDPIYWVSTHRYHHKFTNQVVFSRGLS